MNTSRWMMVAALAGGLLAGACSEDVSVHVACVSTAAPAVECQVEERVGKLEVEVCWDFGITCANGGVVKAERTCQKVKDGATAKVVIPLEKLTGFDTCGGEGTPKAQVTNITLNGRPQEPLVK
ncbi:MAG TPA: hypothetical protein VGB85_15895 [Nannocystis sp.]|jgi:hypothetical protein